MKLPPPSTPPHLLVVDDEPDLLTLYELTLSKSGHRVAAASDLAQARALLATPVSYTHLTLPTTPYV